MSLLKSNHTKQNKWVMMIKTIRSMILDC